MKRVKQMGVIGKVFGMLSGKKTYLVAVILALLAFAKHLGWIDDSFVGKFQPFLEAAGLASLRFAVGNK